MILKLKKLLRRIYPRVIGLSVCANSPRLTAFLIYLGIRKLNSAGDYTVLCLQWIDCLHEDSVYDVPSVEWGATFICIYKN